jgi:SRSO17 transposase
MAEEIHFATKPKLGQAMLKRAFAARTPCAFVVSDSVSGTNHQMRSLIEAHGRSYVLAVTSTQRLGRKPVAEWREDMLAKGWIRLSTDDGW